MLQSAQPARMDLFELIVPPMLVRSLLLAACKDADFFHFSRTIFASLPLPVQYRCCLGRILSHATTVELVSRAPMERPQTIIAGVADVGGG